MIKVYLKILRDSFGITDSDISIEVRIFSGMNPEERLRFWSEATQMSIHDIKLKMNDGGSSGRTKYGICRITIKKGHKYLKLMNALAEEVNEQILNPAGV